jgi:hypothetical protein
LFDTTLFARLLESEERARAVSFEIRRARRASGGFRLWDTAQMGSLKDWVRKRLDAAGYVVFNRKAAGVYARDGFVFGRSNGIAVETGFVLIA